jgi:hypothetical protein
MDWVSFFLGSFVTLNVMCIFWAVGEFLDAGWETNESVYVISRRS